MFGCLGCLVLSGTGRASSAGVWWRSGSCLGGGDLAGGFLGGLLGGCVVVPAVGFPGSVLREGCWCPGSWGSLCLLLIAGGRWPCTLLTEYSSCGTCAMCIACTCPLRFRAIRILGCAVGACCWCCCCFSLLLFCFVFFSVCLLSGAPGGSPPGFPTEAVDCLLFGFWLSGLSLCSLIVSFCLSRFFFFTLPLSLSPCQLRLYYR